MGDCAGFVSVPNPLVEFGIVTVLLGQYMSVEQREAMDLVTTPVVWIITEPGVTVIVVILMVVLVVRTVVVLVLVEFEVADFVVTRPGDDVAFDDADPADRLLA